MLEIKGKSIIDINVNGSTRSVAVRPADTLLYVLREQLGLTGAKNGCENGDCDACTVLMDGWPVKACLMLAVEAIGSVLLRAEGEIYAAVRDSCVDSVIREFGISAHGIIPVAY